MQRFLNLNTGVSSIDIRVPKFFLGTRLSDIGQREFENIKKVFKKYLETPLSNNLLQEKISVKNFSTANNYESLVPIIDKVLDLPQVMGDSVAMEVLGEFFEYLRIKLLSTNIVEVEKTVICLDVMVKNCGYRVHSLVGKKIFIKTLSKVGRRDLSQAMHYSTSGLEMHSKHARNIGLFIMDTLQAWGEAFQPRRALYPHIYNTYLNIKYKYGIEFLRPDFDPTRVPIFLGPISRPEFDMQTRALSSEGVTLGVAYEDVDLLESGLIELDGPLYKRQESIRSLGSTDSQQFASARSLSAQSDDDAYDILPATLADSVSNDLITFDDTKPTSLVPYASRDLIPSNENEEPTALVPYAPREVATANDSAMVAHSSSSGRPRVSVMNSQFQSVSSNLSYNPSRSVTVSSPGGQPTRGLVQSTHQKREYDPLSSDVTLLMQNMALEASAAPDSRDVDDDLTSKKSLPQLDKAPLLSSSNRSDATSKPNSIIETASPLRLPTEHEFSPRQVDAESRPREAPQAKKSYTGKTWIQPSSDHTLDFKFFGGQRVATKKKELT